MWREFVFDGEIEEVVRVEPDDCDGPFVERVPEGEYSLVRVLKVWSGDVGETALVYTPMTSCNRSLGEGERFIFDVFRHDGALLAPGLCSVPPTVEEAEARFGEGVAPGAGKDAFPACVRAQSKELGCRCVSGRPRSESAFIFVVALFFAGRRGATLTT